MYGNKIMANDILSNTVIKQLKGIGHRLNPIVTIGNQGITPTVIEEIGRALTDHELIKIKIPAGSKEERTNTAKALAEATDSIMVNLIGRVCLLFRKNPSPNEKLSNLVRFGY